MSIYRLTEKQIQIISTIHLHHQENGEDIDMNQLLEELPYRTSKQSMQFSLRALVKKGILVKRDGLVTRRSRARITYAITQFGRSLLKL